MSIDVNVQNDLVIVTESSEDIVVNVSNAAGAPGPAGAPGANGVGVPVGGATGQVLKKFTNTDFDTYWAADASGLTSVGLSMPTAFTVSNTPLTTNGTIAVTGAGTAAQYVRGDGQLATFPSTASGGSSVNYYLNGSVNASVAGYKQLANTATIGGGTDFILVGNGLIAQFLTDAGNPNRVEIPGGAWNFEMFFQVSSSGGNQKFYVELLKYDGVTFTSIASSSAVPEEITGGTSIDLYLTSLAVPTTALLVTDRLAIRVYIVDNAAGRTVTLHTEDNTLCEIITTFAGGIAALNGLSANTQYLATGTSGTDFNISSLVDTHTFNLPTASATNRGALSSADWSTFNSKVPTTRTLTINGTSFDLSADRSWTIPSANIYNSDGTLTGNRIVSSGGFSLTYTGLVQNQLGIQISGIPTTWTVANNTYLLQSVFAGDSYIQSYNTSTNLYKSLYIYGSLIGLGNGTSGDVMTIGTNAIVNKGLQVQGSLLGTLTGAGFELEYTGGTAYVTGYNRTISSWLPLVIRGSQIDFFTAGSNRARFTAAGRLLLGTTTESTYLLDVSGTARVSGANELVGVTTFLSGRIASFFSSPFVGFDVSGAGWGFQIRRGGGVQFTIFGSTGAVNIGPETTQVSSSAALAVNATNAGFLPPRMTTTEKNAIATPATGLQVYDITLGSVSVYDGATWRNDTDTVTTNRQAASYTLALTDRGKLVEMNVAGANNLTVPLNSVIAFPIGTKIDLSQYGAGQTTVVATGGVTVRSAGGALKLALQYSGASLVKIATDEWYLFGDITV